MATTSLSSTILTSIPLFNSTTIPTKPEIPFLHFPSSIFQNPKPLRLISRHHSSSSSFTRIRAVPEGFSDGEETLEESQDEEWDDEEEVFEESVNDEVLDSESVEATSKLSIPVEAETLTLKQKIRIKLRSYWVPLIEDSCKQIMDAAKSTNAQTMGPVPLPTKKRVYCLLKSPHVDKDARFHFEIRTHQRLIDILYPTAQTIDSLMLLDIPAGVDVEVKL